MKMKIAHFVLLLLLVLAVDSKGQSVATPDDCPTVGISGPLAAVSDGDTAIFAVTLSGDGKVDAARISYEWSVVNGEITGGRDTAEISVRVTGKTTATVNVRGLDEGCNSKVSITVRYGNVKPSPILFDEFGKVKEKLLEKRISALKDILKNNPGSQAYFVSYGSEKDVAGRESEIRRHSGGTDISSWLFVNAGVEKQIRTRVWIVPPGADTSELN